jgi:hypothetical protein
MSEKSKTGIRYYKFEIILISLVISIILIYELGNIVINYIAGLNGNPFHALVLVPFFLLLFGLFIILLVIAFIHFIWLAIKAFKAKKLDWLKALLSLVPFLFVVFYFFDWHFTKSGAVYFLQGYEKWVQKEVDIASIQKWLLSLDKVYSDKRYFEAKDFPEELPKAVTKLKPYHMYFGKFDSKNRNVEFEWGSALGHWGIKIGLPSMEMPKENYIKLDGNDVEFRRPIQPGVYIFERG